MKDPSFSLSQEHSDNEELVYLRKIIGLRLVHVLFVFGEACLFFFIDEVYEFSESKLYLALLFKASLVPIAIILFKVEAIGKSLILSAIFGILFTLGLGAMLGSLFSLFFEQWTGFIVLTSYVTVNFAVFLSVTVERKTYKVPKALFWILGITIVNITAQIFIFHAEHLALLIVAVMFAGFGVFSVVHSKMIAQGKFRVIPRERYVLGALCVYVDFFMLKFVIIQKCCNKRKEEDEAKLVKD
ncbi:unnamed protein product [Blepharisma stoltei]|uniref:Uncharacterized protein n=1 Tax=Blepharisma stoltei TaxID=1481888 RepID=A0AAU9JZB8_9CILI|nr:unnamed protein product [Blepharisma stoltei]